MLKKIKDFILSLILPRRMYRYHNLHIFYSVVILIGTALIILFSVNLSTEKFTRQMILSPDFNINNYYQIDKITFPEYKIAQSNSGGYYLDVLVGTETTDTYQKVFNTTLENENNELEITIVIDEGCDFFKSENPSTNIDPNLFDLNAYMMQYRNNSRNNNDKEYLLFILTKKSFYYLYNLGQIQDEYKDWHDSQNRLYGSYEKTATGEINYFLPTNEDEANCLDIYGNYDVTKWTTQTSEGNSTIINGTKYVAEKRINNNLRTAIYNGEYVYSNIDVEMINGEGKANFYQNDLIEAIKANVELMIASDASIQKNMYSFFAILINVLISFVWVAITWLLSRKFVMNKFKEYYAICAISYIPISIVFAIFALFIRFDNLMIFLLITELIYYIFVTFRINTDPNLLDNNCDKEVLTPTKLFKKPTKPNLDFQQVKSDDSYTVE